MITAWVFFYDTKDQRYKLEERQGMSYQSTDPKEWGLPVGFIILLVFQKASFLAAWALGNEVHK